jgi:hypothetical protein
MAKTRFRDQFVNIWKFRGFLQDFRDLNIIMCKTRRSNM